MKVSIIRRGLLAVAVSLAATTLPATTIAAAPSVATTQAQAQAAYPGAEVLVGHVMSHDGTYLQARQTPTGPLWAYATVKTTTSASPLRAGLATPNFGGPWCGGNHDINVYVQTGWIGSVGSDIALNSEYTVNSCYGAYGDWATPNCAGFLITCNAGWVGWAPRQAWTANAWYDQNITHGIFGTGYAETYHLRTYCQGNQNCWSWWS